MAQGFEKYGLDLHCTSILEEYAAALPLLQRMRSVVEDTIRTRIEEKGIYVTAIESRIKTEKSLAGKLEIKGAKYASMNDITDLLGLRIITFYTDEVDKISALVDKVFDVDWQNSVDKRKMHDLDSFGYSSLHYICRIPPSLYCEEGHPEINTIRFEVQMRTALQHVWSTMDHDTGYKKGVEVPKEYIRSMVRLAGLLELADEQFSQLRTNITNYRRQVQNLLNGGRFDDVPLDGDTFRSYLKLRPFDRLTKKIAAINQAEVTENSFMPYLAALKMLGCRTLGDLERMIKENSEDAYRLAVYQLGDTDLDIISSTVSLQDIMIVHMLKNGGGELGLKKMFDRISGESEYNMQRAHRVMADGNDLQLTKNNG